MQAHLISAGDASLLATAKDSVLLLNGGSLLSLPPGRSYRLTAARAKSKPSESKAVQTSSESKFACDICGETWQDTAHLVRHKDSMHKPGPDSPHICTRGDWCNAICETKYEFAVHLSSCFYPCPEPGCDVTGLKWAREITRHMNMHKSLKERSSRISQVMTQGVAWDRSLFASR